MRRRLAVLSSVGALALVVPAAASADATATCTVDGTTVTSTGTTTASCSLDSRNVDEASSSGDTLTCAVVALDDAADPDSSAGAEAMAAAD